MTQSCLNAYYLTNARGGGQAQHERRMSDGRSNPNRYAIMLWAKLDAKLESKTNQKESVSWQFVTQAHAGKAV